MTKLKMHSKDLTQDNIAKIQVLFPNCVTEAQDADGELRLAVDFDLLKQELASDLVEGPQERYRLDWPGKREAMLLANSPIAKTLRPARDESVSFDSTENLFIEGDNLEALKLLQENYLGKVKMIYIDPPYNTGNDFVYNDDFAESREEYFERSIQKDEEGNRLVANTESNGRYHSDWLSMMLPRLKLARNLLSDDGVIFISIDDNESHNLKKLCSEVFGEANFLAEIAWQGMDTVKNDAKYFSSNFETILCFGKNIEFVNIKGTKRTEKHNKVYKNRDKDPRGPYLLTPIHAKSGSAEGVYEYKFENGFVWKPPVGTYPRFSKETLLKLEQDGRIYFSSRDNSTPQRKTFLSEVSQFVKLTTFWDYKFAGSTRQSNKELADLGLKSIFSNPKPTNLMRILTNSLVESNDVVLDLFAGSSTTAHAVMQLNAEDGGNRKFIMVQLPEEIEEKHEAFKAGYKTIAEISKERIRRAGKQILEGDCHENWNKDVGFRVLKVDSSNMKDVYYRPAELTQHDLANLVSPIKADRSSEDLLFQVMLDLGLELNLPIDSKTLHGKEVFFVANNRLIACFEPDISEELLLALTEYQPLRVVFADTCFGNNDSLKTNAKQIFKQRSSDTSVMGF